MAAIDKALAVFGLQRKSSAVEWTDGRGQGAIGDAGEVVTPRSAMSMSAVWACSNLISGTISSLPLQVFTAQPDGTRTQNKGHPLYSVLHDSPNFDQTALDFWDYINLSIELWGNGYARKIRGNDGRIISLRPIKPDSITVRRLPAGPLEYRWTEDARSYVETEEEVLHIRGPGGDPLGGMSTLTFARNSFSAAQAAERAAAGMFRNGLRPSGVIKFKEWLTPEQRAIAHASVAEKYLGAVNSGRPFIAEGGMEYQHLTISPEDAQMLETRQFSIEEVCRFFGVPPVLIGHAGASTAWPTSVEQQQIMFIQFTLRRRLKRIEQAIQKQLLSAEDRARGVVVEWNIEGLLRGDSAARAAFYGAGLQAGWLTINEVRRRENMPAVAGGETPRMQMQNVPITQAGTE
jgi:HK97 family phage portal protein